MQTLKTEFNKLKNILHDHILEQIKKDKL